MAFEVMNCVVTVIGFVVSMVKVAPGPKKVVLPRRYASKSQPFLAQTPSARWSGLSPQSTPVHLVCSLTVQECAAKAVEIELACHVHLRAARSGRADAAGSVGVSGRRCWPRR